MSKIELSEHEATLLFSLRQSFLMAGMALPKQFITNPDRGTCFEDSLWQWACSLEPQEGTNNFDDAQISFLCSLLITHEVAANVDCVELHNKLSAQ